MKHATSMRLSRLMVGRQQELVPCFAGLTSFHRKAYRRFKGPYLDEVTLQAVKAQPRDWMLLGAWAYSGAYNVPEDSAMLQERIEENLVVFLVGSGREPRADALLCRPLSQGSKPSQVMHACRPTTCVSQLFWPSCRCEACSPVSFGVCTSSARLEASASS